MAAPLLQVVNLHAEIAEEGTEVLKGVDLEIGEGEIHAIMGPNGSGKSTLSKVISGHPSYEVTDGDILFRGESVLDMEPDERAQAGARQMPQPRHLRCTQDRRAAPGRGVLNFNAEPRHSTATITAYSACGAPLLASPRTNCGPTL